MLHKLDKYAFRDDREKLASSKDHWTDIFGVAVDWNGEINFNDHNKIFLRVFHSERKEVRVRESDSFLWSLLHDRFILTEH